MVRWNKGGFVKQSGHLDDGPYLTVNKVLKPLQKLTSQHIYWELINPKSKPPSSLGIWVDLFPFLDKLDWSNIFTLVNRVTDEPYLQTFQYKVLNRTLNCRYNLYKWKISQSPFCTHCNGTHVDTIEHLVTQMITLRSNRNITKTRYHEPCYCLTTKYCHR